MNVGISSPDKYFIDFTDDFLFCFGFLLSFGSQQLSKTFGAVDDVDAVNNGRVSFKLAVGKT